VTTKISNLLTDAPKIARLILASLAKEFLLFAKNAQMVFEKELNYVMTEIHRQVTDAIIAYLNLDTIVQVLLLSARHIVETDRLKAMKFVMT